jgi:hypothetical protein
MSIKLEGFDEAQRKLQDLIDKAQAIPKEEQIPLNQLLTPAFMREHTEFETVATMLEGSGFKIESAEDFTNIPEAEWDGFIAQNTEFSTWREMLQAAHVERVKRQMGF